MIARYIFFLTASILPASGSTVIPISRADHRWRIPWFTAGFE